MENIETFATHTLECVSDKLAGASNLFIVVLCANKKIEMHFVLWQEITHTHTHDVMRHAIDDNVHEH